MDMYCGCIPSDHGSTKLKLACMMPNRPAFSKYRVYKITKITRTDDSDVGKFIQAMETTQPPVSLYMNYTHMDMNVLNDIAHNVKEVTKQTEDRCVKMKYKCSKCGTMVYVVYYFTCISVK